VSEVDIKGEGFKRLSFMFAEEAGQDFDWNHFQNSWLEFTEIGFAHTIGHFKEEALVGMIGFTVTPDMFSGKLSAGEIFLYVDKEHRSSRIGVSLLKAFEDKASELCCTEVVIAHFNHLNAEKLKSIYKRLDYKNTEDMYRKCLK